MRRFAFRWRLWVAGLLAGVVLLWVPAALDPQPAAAHGGETVTTELQPGWNLAGWTEGEAPVSAIFRAIPQLRGVYAWDVREQAYRWPTRTSSGRFSGKLKTLRPGMGLWLHLGGDEPFTWTRPIISDAGLVDLRPGWNLVGWAGEDGIATRAATSELRDILLRVANADGFTPSTLRRGGAIWIKVSSAKQWWQVAPVPRVEFDGQFTSRQKQELQTYVEDVVAFFVERHGFAIPDLTVRFGNLTADMVCSGYGDEVLYVREDCITGLPFNYSLAAQEYFATIDAEGNWGTIVSKIGPSWLSMGVANYAAAVYKDLNGIRPIEEWITDAIDIGLANANSLKDLERNLDAGDSVWNFHLASLAAKWIVDTYGEAALYDFYRNRNETFWWHTAFRDTFGTSVDWFYEKFEAYRASLAAERSRIEGRVIGPDGRGVEDVRVEAILLDGGAQWKTVTGADGAFSQPTSEGIYRLSLFLGDTPCHIGWYSSRHGHTLTRWALTPLNVPESTTTGITIRLPRPPAEYCSKIKGMVLNAEGEPYRGHSYAWVAAWPVHDQDGYSGAHANIWFDLDVRAGGSFDLSIHSHYVRECTVSPHRALELKAPGSRARVAVGEDDVTGLVLNVTTGPKRAKEFVDCTVAR